MARTGQGKGQRSSGTRAATEQRFAERATQARAVRLRRWLVGVLALALVAGVVWAVYFSALLDVRSIEVTGADPADEAAVEQVAEQERGRPLARVDGDAVGEQISDDVRGAKAARVERGWPHTLEVKVTSRVPELAVSADKGKYRLLDIDGVAIRTVSTPPKDVPTVTPDQGATVSAHGVEATSGMLQEMPEELRDDISRITVDDADQVRFRVRGTTVVWGDAASPDVKVRVIPVLLEKKPDLIDVSAPDTPVTKG